MKRLPALPIVLLTGLLAACGSEASGWDLLSYDAASGVDATLQHDASSADGLDVGIATAHEDASGAVDAALSPQAGDAGVVVDLGPGPDPEDPPPPQNPDPAVPAAYSAEMTWVTANVGRNYSTRADVRAVFDKIGDAVANKTSPKFIGWQEIGEGDPCGNCEIEEINARFAGGWANYRPRGTRPDGGTERVKVPISSRGANNNVVRRAAFASPGWAGVSPTRFVMTTYHPSHNVSVVNTHLIAGAWSCKSNVAKRRDYWRRGWRTLKAEVAKEREKGRNVIVTGDLNRPRAANNCNPQWDPASLHPAARIVGGVGIDYIFAVPAASQRFRTSKRADGSVKRGAITLGIDGHKAHWLMGHFEGT